MRHPEVLSKCLSDHLSDETLSDLTSLFDADKTNIGNAIDEYVYPEKVCMDDKGNNVDFADKTTCEAEKVCNDGSQTCQDSEMFCGKYCTGPHGRCQEVEPHFQDETSCARIGTCAITYRGEIMAAGETFDASCDELKYCTAGLDEEFTEANCAQHGFCEAFPLEKDGCIFDFMETSRYCDGGLEIVGDLGCLDATITDQRSCTSRGGSWITVPQDEESCLSHERCITESYGFNEEHPVSRRSVDECSKCGGQIQSLFKWRKGEWVSSKFIGQTEWKRREMVPKNIWARTITSDTMREENMNMVSYWILETYIDKG